MLWRQDSTFESIIWDQQMPDLSLVVCVTVGNFFISLSCSGLVYQVRIIEEHIVMVKTVTYLKMK